MFKPLEPLEFCEKWVPKKKGVTPDKRSYRKACAELLAELTGYKQESVRPWLFAPDRVPALVKRYLRVVDRLWQLEDLFNKAFEIFQNRS
jgi:hypothetical protein